MEQRPNTFSRRVIRGELLIQFGHAATQGLGLMNAFLVLKALSVHDFGLYQLILATIALAGSLSAGLFDDIAVNEVARGLAAGRPADAKRLFREFGWYQMFAGGALAIALFLGAGRIAAHYGQNIGLLIRIASFLLAFEAIRTAEELLFVATASLVPYATQVVQEGSRFAILAGLFFWGRLSLPGVLLASLAATAGAILFSSVVFFRRHQKFFGGVAPARRGMLVAALRRYGTVVFVRYGVSRVTKNIRPWLVKFFLGTEAVAFWALAVNLITFAQGLFPLAMVSRLLPWEAGEPARLRFIFIRSVKYVLWGGIALAVGAVIIVPPLITALFPKYAPAMPLFRALLLLLPLYGVYKFYKSLLVMLREQWILTTRIVSESVATIALNVMLLPLMGIMGIAVEYTATYAWRVWLFYRALNRVHPELRVKPANLFFFDAEDLRFFQNLGSMVLQMFRGRPA